MSGRSDHPIRLDSLQQTPATQITLATRIQCSADPLGERGECGHKFWTKRIVQRRLHPHPIPPVANAKSSALGSAENSLNRVQRDQKLYTASVIIALQSESRRLLVCVSVCVCVCAKPQTQTHTRTREMDVCVCIN